MDDTSIADELLRRALIDADVARRSPCGSRGLPLCEPLTVVFHGRRDLGTIQTYVDPRRPRRRLRRRRRRPAARAVRPRPRRAEDRDEAEQLYAEQAAAMRDALVGADPCSTSGASRSRTSRTRAWRSTAASRSTSASPRTGCCPPRSSRPRSGWSSPRCARAAAGRGPPADGHRVRPAGRRPRLPAARRPGALPRGLPRASRPSTRGAWPSSSAARSSRSERFLELSGDGFASR